jgi:hypothetical protein
MGTNVNPSIKAATADAIMGVLGAPRASRQWPLRSALRFGTTLTSASDWPVRSPDWRAGVIAAVLREDLFCTGLGAADLELNGRRVDEDVLSPGWTSYHDRLVHETVDVTELLRPGDNVLGAWLAGAWYTERYGFGALAHRAYGDQRPHEHRLRRREPVRGGHLTSANRRVGRPGGTRRIPFLILDVNQAVPAPDLTDPSRSDRSAPRRCLVDADPGGSGSSTDNAPRSRAVVQMTADRLDGPHRGPEATPPSSVWPAPSPARAAAVSALLGTRGG